MTCLMGPLSEQDLGRPGAASFLATRAATATTVRTARTPMTPCFTEHLRVVTRSDCTDGVSHQRDPGVTLEQNPRRPQSISRLDALARRGGMSSSIHNVE